MNPFDVYGAPLQGTQLIEASAGTGKTWTLCGLVLRLLLERRLPVQQILVVTFTKTATAELRQRIRGRIVEMQAALLGNTATGSDPFVPTLLTRLRAAGRHDDELAALLDQALQGFDEAAVFTIHSFCQRALADTPFAAGMPLTLEAINDDRSLRLQVVQDFWRQHVSGADLSPALAATLLQHKDDPDRWAELLRESLTRPLAELLWPDAIDDATDMPDPAALAAAHAAAQALWHAERAPIIACLQEPPKQLNGTSYKPATIQQAIDDWDRLLAAGDPLAVDSKLEKLHLLCRDTLVEKTNKNKLTPEHAFFDAAQALFDLRAQATQALAMQRLRLLRALLVQAPETLRQRQREQQTVSYDNMLFNLYQRLQGTEGDRLVAALRARFGAALIDEFQDTDPLQFNIFQRLFGNGAAPLFLIGDPKQAIYGFRGADLHTYLRARPLADDEGTLTHNQRSTGHLLSALNALFGQRPDAFVLPGLAYHPVSEGSKPKPVLDDRSHTDGPPAAMPLWQLPDDPPLRKPDALAAAAQACAGEIVRLLAAAQQGLVRLGPRPLAGGDIAVLVRSRAQGSRMRAALAQRGVASVELAQDSVFDSVDADALTQVLAAMLVTAPGDRARRLRAALATEVMGWRSDDLLALEDDDAPWLDLLARFGGYRTDWQRQGLGAMLRRWMVGEGVHARLLSRPDGERRLTNLMHLAELLQQAERDHPSPDALWRWLLAQRGQGRGDETTQLRLESDRQLVQVVTIHASKGLEYPIVFCPFLWDGAKGRLGRSWHRPDGSMVIDHREQIDADTKAQLRLEQAAETVRLIYVALTRAVHRCHLVVGSYAVRDSTTESVGSQLNRLIGGGPSEQAWPAWVAAQARPGMAAPVSLAPLPADDGATVVPQRPAPASIAALPVPTVPAGWWIGSFSALAQDIRHERAAVDHDADAAADAIADNAPATRTVADDDILRFPRGPAAGDLLHAVFEHADFCDRSGWPAAIDRALQTQPLPADATDRAAWPSMLTHMLDDVLQTPLPDGPQLNAVTRPRRLVEWAFMLPAAGLDANALFELLHQEGWPVPPLAFGHLQGYLRGFVDLVFEHDGRWSIADWKSNHLGDQPADYADAPMQAAMRQHGYALQGLLYAVALQRHLQQRLPGYKHARHFGSVRYLFVRGMRPGWQQADGRPCGVVTLQPSARLLDRLSALMQGART